MLSRFASIALLAFASIPAIRGAEHQVTVGGPGILKYDPEFVTAVVGDTVIFTFKQKNHTVTQSTFQLPCVAADGGFDSGFVPVPDNQTDSFPAAQFTVGDTNPVWVYCRQTNHCQQGMVFAINPGDKFAAFQAAATGNTTDSNTTATSTSSGGNSTAASVTSTDSASITTVTATVTVSGSAQVTTYTTAAGSAATATATSTSTSTPVNHVVTVGGANLVFSPSNITAQVGDTVTFMFMQKNHTATQSSFANPCTSLTETSTNGQIGFDSGFMPVASGATSSPSFQITVNDTSPIWAFCRQTNPSSHCAAGMVFSVNAIESGANNFAAFKAKAMQTNSTGSSSSKDNSASAMGASRGAGAVAVLISIVAGVLL